MVEEERAGYIRGACLCEVAHAREESLGGGIGETGYNRFRSSCHEEYMYLQLHLHTDLCVYRACDSTCNVCYHTCSVDNILNLRPNFQLPHSFTTHHSTLTHVILFYLEHTLKKILTQYVQCQSTKKNKPK